MNLKYNLYLPTNASPYVTKSSQMCDAIDDTQINLANKPKRAYIRMCNRM